MMIVTGWWFLATPLKNMKVSWDDDIANISGKIKFMATSHHQPVIKYNMI